MENIDNIKFVYEILKIGSKTIDIIRLTEFPNETKNTEIEQFTIIGLISYIVYNYEKIDKIHIFEKDI